MAHHQTNFHDTLYRINKSIISLIHYVHILHKQHNKIRTSSFDSCYLKEGPKNRRFLPFKRYSEKTIDQNKEEEEEEEEEETTDSIEEQEFKKRRLESIKACLKEMHEHCIQFFENDKRKSSWRDPHCLPPTYEEWISVFHPENVIRSLSSQNPFQRKSCYIIDHRFYVQDSDHRIIWNGYCDFYGFPEQKIDYFQHSLEARNPHSEKILRRRSTFT